MYNNMNLPLSTDPATHNLSCFPEENPGANGSNFPSQNVSGLINSMLEQNVNEIKGIVQQAQAAEQQAQAQFQAGMQQAQDQIQQDMPKPPPPPPPPPSPAPGDDTDPEEQIHEGAGDHYIQ